MEFPGLGTLPSEAFLPCAPLHRSLGRQRISERSCTARYPKVLRVKSFQKKRARKLHCGFRLLFGGPAEGGPGSARSLAAN